MNWLYALLMVLVAAFVGGGIGYCIGVLAVRKRAALRDLRRSMARLEAEDPELRLILERLREADPFVRRQTM